MSDNFGPKQDRVLNVEGRSLDNVVFQNTIPSLTSELNLINQISNDKSQKNLKSIFPSGWLKVDSVEQVNASSTTDTSAETEAEDNARCGQALCSITYGANSFKLVSKDASNIAIVNGWPIVVQGSNSSDNNSILTLPPSTGSYRYDVVFLEVWRKLVGQNDSLYPYGNVDATPFTDKEIVWDTVGFETTKRIQIQYRIRTYNSNNYASPIDFDSYPEGLGSPQIKAVGGNPSGTYTSLSFSSAGQKDIGLYVAGSGSAADKATLDTVDGYVYAIPMFVVYRRAEKDFSTSAIHGAKINISEANSGYRSDRPDGQLLDSIYESDIVDARHLIVSPGQNINSILSRSFRKLVTGELKTSIGKAFSNTGERYPGSGGSSLLKIEQLNGSGSLPNIGSGSQTESTDFKRRAFCNSSVEHGYNILEVPINGSSSYESGNITITDFFNPSYGEIVRIDDFYWKDISSGTSGEVSDVDHTGTATIDIGVNANIIPSNITTIDKNRTLYMVFTFKYYSSNSGFKDYPKNIIEASKDFRVPIATRGNDVRLRVDNNLNTLKFDNNGKSATDNTTSEDYVHYAGGIYSESHEFGHDLVIHRNLGSSQSISIQCPNGKLNGYKILGVKTVQQEESPGLGVYGNPLAFSINRSITSPNVIYTVTIPTATTNSKLRITLITGSAFGDPESNTFKFFETNKEGRGVTDTYEMIEYDAEFVSGNQWVVDTENKPILAIASKTSYAGSYVSAVPYVLAGSATSINSVTPQANIPGVGSTSSINKYLPVKTYFTDWLPTRINLEIPGTHSVVKVSLLVHSYVSVGESPYNFMLKINPYQGILKATSKYYGKVEKQGPAIITSKGSGAISNYSYSQGTATISNNSRTVTGIGTEWAQYVKSGDYISIDGSDYFRVLSVTDNTQLTLAETFLGPQNNKPYSIVRLDFPKDNVSNIIDRMPSYSFEDYKAIGTSMSVSSFEGSLYQTQPKLRGQDPLDTIINDFAIGSSYLVNGNTQKLKMRGKYNFVLTEGKNDFIKLGFLTPHIEYETVQAVISGSATTWTDTAGVKKVCQVYLFNSSVIDTTDGDPLDLSGRVYMLVITSETSNTAGKTLLSAHTVNDTVDLFELEGRPIIKTV
jgi:hypothetical protein